jgi:hypothetical protein
MGGFRSGTSGDERQAAPAPPSPSPNRVRTPRWLDARLVGGLVLVLAAVLIGAKVVSGAQHTRRVLALTRSLAAGATLRADDLTQVDVRLPSNQIYLADQDKAVGRQLNRPLGKGELLPAAALGTPDESTTISVPLQARDAPQLRRGERVEIWLSTPACSSVVLLADVTVQDVHAGSDAIGAGVGQDVVLTVSPQLADRVVAALADKDAVIRAGVLTGTSAQDVATNLPSLTGCLAGSS